MGGSESVSIYDLLYIEFIKVKRGIGNHHSFQCLLALVVGVWSGGIALDWAAEASVGTTTVPNPVPKRG